MPPLASSARRTPPRRWATRVAAAPTSVDLPVLVFGVAITVSAVLLFALGSQLTFLIDEWDLLLQRRGLSAGVLLDPHNEHIVLAPVLIWKLIQATLGMESIAPYTVPAIAVFLASVVLLFVYLRRRVGPWLALAGAAPVLFLGSAWEDLLSPFQIGYFGSMACGLGMLLALDRGGRRDGPLAAVLLTLSLTFSSLGLPFAVGAAIEVGRRPDRLRRAYIVAVPVALYAAWWLGWGQAAENQLSLSNVSASPGYVLDGFASSLSSLFGFVLGPGDFEASSLSWGRPLLVAALVGAIVLGLRTRERTTHWLWIVAGIAFVFWLLTALNAGEWYRAATVPRYRYVGVIFVLLIAAEVLRDIRPSRAVLAVVLTCAVFSIVGNLWLLRDAYQGLGAASERVRGGLAGLEIARERADPELELTNENSGWGYLGFVDAGSYLSAIDQFGSPAYDPTELAGAPEAAREAADTTLATALQLTAKRSPRPASASCLVSPLRSDEPRVFSLPPGGAVIQLRSGAARARLRRFASESFPVDLGALPRGAVSLAIPLDRSTQPWELELQGAGQVGLCRP